MASRYGLKPTETMRQANEQYRKEENKLEEFIEEYCTKDLNLSVRCGDFYMHYEGWLKRMNHQVLNRKVVRSLMQKYGHSILKKHPGVEHYIGIDVNHNTLGM